MASVLMWVDEETYKKLADLGDIIEDVVEEDEEGNKYVLITIDDGTLLSFIFNGC